MTPQEVQQLIEEALSQFSLSALDCPYHRHTTTDVGQLNAGESLIGAPQTAITAEFIGTAGATYGTTEQNLINNDHQRINDIYKKLQNLNLFK